MTGILRKPFLRRISGVMLYSRVDYLQFIPCIFYLLIEFSIFSLTRIEKYCMIVPVLIECVSVAQLDRASDYGSEGRVFESCHSQKERISMDIRFLFCKKPVSAAS